MGCSASQVACQTTEVSVESSKCGVREHVVAVTQHERAPLGLKFSVTSGRLLVRLVEAGLIKEWNVKNPGEQVKVGDEVLCVNGVADDMAKMLTQLHMAGQLEISFRSSTPGASCAGGKHKCCERRATGGSQEAAPRRKAKGTQLVELPFVSAAHLEDATCCICLESMEPDVRVLQLPCKHHFHLECGAQWLRQKGTCPLCVRPLVPEEAEEEPAAAAESQQATTMDSESN